MADGVPGLRLIAFAARMVPAARRATWRKEWEGEVTWAWKRLTSAGRPSTMAVARLRLRVLTCLIDALWEMKETMTMTGLLNDVRFAARSLFRYPMFTAIAVLTLALGIGANTAVFTLVDGVLLSPLPYSDSERLVSIEHLGRDGQDELSMSTGLYALYREHVTATRSLALHTSAAVNLVSNGESERIAVQAVTPGFFEVLGVSPSSGRAFVDEEGAPGGEQVVILSDGMWKSRFGGDPSAIGQSLDINGTNRRIIGIMPEEFGYPDRTAQLWLPLVVDPTTAPLAAFGPSGIARLADDASIESLDTELRGLISRLMEFFPDSGAPAFLAEVGLRPLVSPLKEAVVGEVGTTLLILLGTVGFVLLIACANVANLLLVRAEGRQRELALRIAVGAGRAQVLRTFLSESIILAGAGSLLGLVVARISLTLTTRMLPSDLPRAHEVGLDLRVLGFTFAIAVGCALFFGLFPLLRYNADDLGTQLRDGAAHGATGGRDRNRLRSSLVVVQMALALVLLVGSGLMLRSFQALRAMDPGFETERILTARITVPEVEISSWQEAAGFYRTLGDRLRGQSGVEAVGFAQSVPLGAGLGFYSVELEDHPRGPSELPVFASNNQIEVGFLETMGIDLVEGRTFVSGDGAEGTRVVVVSKSFADHWWPGRSALGRNVRLGFPEEEWYQIVGVVEDTHYLSLENDPQEMIFWPATIGTAANPQPTRGMDVAVRTAGDPTAFVAVLRREVQALNPRIPVSNPRTMDDLMSAATARTSFTMSLLGAASGIALLLGLVGIYGVISYIVSQRTREIGVRLALGATAPSVRGMIVRQGFVLTAGGVCIGLVVAAGLSRVMASLLYGVSATDPLTYGLVAVSLVIVSLSASWIPARRAAGVDPSRALRSE